MSADPFKPDAPEPAHVDEATAPASSARVAEALVESEERYRSIVTAMSEGIVLQDVHGRIIECNAAAERILGLSRAQMTGLTSLDPRWAAVDATGAPVRGEDHPIRVTLRTGEPKRDVVMGLHRADGTKVWVSVNTQPLFRPGETRPFSVVASFADITESRAAEAALRESEARFRSLYEHSIDGVLLTDPTGPILAANPEACRLLRRTEAEICAAGREGILEMDDPGLQAAIRERAVAGKVRGEMTCIRGDGTRFPGEFSSAIFTDRDGNLRTSLTFRDVSRRKEAEDALRHANQRLEDRVAERTRELAALLEISREIVAQLELEPLLAHILVTLKTVLDYTGAAVALLEGDEMLIVDYAGPAPREEIVGARIPLTPDSGYRRVIEQRAPVIVDDIWGEVRAPDGAWPIWDEAISQSMSYARSWLGVPLIGKGKALGLLRLDHVEPGRFTPEDTERALGFAYYVSVAVLNARATRRRSEPPLSRSANGLRETFTTPSRKRCTGSFSARRLRSPGSSRSRQRCLRRSSSSRASPGRGWRICDR